MGHVQILEMDVPERTIEEEEEAITNFNEALKESSNPDEVELIREAAEKCPLVETVARFPKRPNKEEHKHYTSDGWRLSKCLVAIRQMRIQALTLADGEQITEQTINQTKRRVVKTEEKRANLSTGKQCASIWKATKKGERSVGQHAEHGHKQDPGCRTERICRNSVHEIIQTLHQITGRERNMERRAKKDTSRGNRSRSKKIQGEESTGTFRDHD